MVAIVGCTLPRKDLASTYHCVGVEKLIDRMAWVMSNLKHSVAARLTVLMLGALVLFFVAWSKLPIYSAHALSVEPTASKLWLTSEKIEPQCSNVTLDAVLVFLEFTFLLSLHLPPAITAKSDTILAICFPRLTQLGTHCFLRPPPVFQL